MSLVGAQDAGRCAAGISGLANDLWKVYAGDGAPGAVVSDQRAPRQSSLLLAMQWTSDYIARRGLFYDDSRIIDTDFVETSIYTCFARHCLDCRSTSSPQCLLFSPFTPRQAIFRLNCRSDGYASDRSRHECDRDNSAEAVTQHSDVLHSCQIAIAT